MTWLLWAVLALVLNGAWGLIARTVLRDFGWQILAFLNFLGYFAAVLVISLANRPEANNLDWPAAGKAISVGLFSQLGVILFYQALASGGKAAVVVPIAALFPIVTITAAILILNESLTYIQAVGVFLAVVAVALLARGRGEEA